jgi:hypothetical protein
LAICDVLAIVSFSLFALSYSLLAKPTNLFIAD